MLLGVRNVSHCTSTMRQAPVTLVGGHFYSNRILRLCLQSDYFKQLNSVESFQAFQFKTSALSFSAAVFSTTVQVFFFSFAIFMWSCSASQLDVHILYTEFWNVLFCILRVCCGVHKFMNYMDSLYHLDIFVSSVLFWKFTLKKACRKYSFWIW